MNQLPEKKVFVRIYKFYIIIKNTVKIINVSVLEVSFNYQNLKKKEVKIYCADGYTNMKVNNTIKLMLWHPCKWRALCFTIVFTNIFSALCPTLMIYIRTYLYFYQNLYV